MSRGAAAETEKSAVTGGASGFTGGRTALDARGAGVPGFSLGRDFGMAADLDAERAAGSLVRYGRVAAGESAEVRAVSRSIQRDARRYDGGFSIY